MKKAVFLDRDGVVSKKLDTHEYVTKVEGFEFRDGIFEFMRFLEDSNFLLIVISNQSCVQRGLLSVDDLSDIHLYMVNELKRNGINMSTERIYYCPHYDDRCYFRKPNPGMVLSAIKDFDITREGSWFIGDSQVDLEAAINAGIRDVIIMNQDKEAFEKAMETIKSNP